MRKKILIPLLVSPMAFPALADINMGFPSQTDWNQEGATGDQNTWSDDGKGCTCTIGTGSLTTTLNNYPAGTYRICFSSKPDNLTINVGSKEVELQGSGTEGYYAEFSTDGTDGITVKFSATDKALGFSFVGKQILLVFDATEPLDKLKEQYNELGTPEAVADGDLFDEAVKLKTRLTKIEGSIAKYNGTPFGTVWENIKNIGSTTSPAPYAQIEIYKEYGFDKSVNNIEEYLNELAAAISTYNEDVTNENATYELYEENVKTQNDLLAEAKSLQPANEALIENIKAWQNVPDDIKKDIEEKAEAQKTAIAEYIEAIEKAYPYKEGNWEVNKALREKIDFTPEYTDLNKTNENLSKEFADLQSDYEVYYNVNFELIPALQTAYNAYADSLTKAEGVEGFTDVYSDIATNGFTVSGTDADGASTTTELYSAAKAEAEYQAGTNLQIAEVAGASAEAANQTELNDLIAGFNDMTAALENLVETQNNNMTAAQTTIKGYKAKIDDYKERNVEGSFADGFNTQLKALTTAFEEFKTSVDEAYKEHALNLTGTDYTGKTTDIENKITSLENYLGEKGYEVITNLLAQLTEAEAAVKGDVKVESLKNDEGDGHIDIYEKWKSTFENYEAAILDLTPEQCTNSEVTDPIEVGIDKTKTDAIQMAADFVKVNEKIELFKTQKDAFVKFVNSKEIKGLESITDLKEKYLEEYTGTKGAFTKVLDGYLSERAAAYSAENGQECWDAITTLANKLPEEELTTADGKTVSVVEQTFSFEGSNLNAEYAEEELGNFISDYDQAVTPKTTNVADLVFGTSSDTTDSLREKLTNIRSGISSAADTETLSDIDDEIISFIEKLDEYKSKLEAAKTNQSAFDTLMGTVARLESDLKDAVEYNNGTSMDPGKSHFAEVLEGISVEIEALVKALQESLEGGTVVEDRDSEDGYKKQIEDIEENISDQKAAILANNQAHNDQLAKERKVRNTITGYITTINEQVKDSGLTSGNTWSKDLQSLLDNDMVAANNNVTDAYGKGESKSQNTDLMAAYNTILSKADGIYEDFMGKDENSLLKAVDKENQVRTDAWDILFSDMESAYREAISTYNRFYYDAENEGWHDYIHQPILRHEDLFKFFGEYNTLNDEVTNAISDSTSNLHVITNDEYAVWAAEANDIIEAINDEEVKLWTDVDGLAAEYYNQQHAAAQSAITEAAGQLSEAGIAGTYLDDTKNLLTIAEGLYEAHKGGHIAEAMDAVCDALDKVIPSIKIADWAEDSWNKEYKEAVTEYDALQTKIKECVYATDDAKAKAQESLSECETGMKALNEKAAADKSLIENYKEYKDQLDGYLAALEDAADELQTNNDGQVEENNLSSEWDETWKPGLDKAYNDLSEYCNSLGGASGMESTLKTINKDIDSLAEVVKANLGKLAALDPTLEERVDDIKTSITSAYRAAFDAEVTFLRDMIARTKIAFNDAYAADPKGDKLPEGETYNELDAAITGQSDIVEKLPGQYNAEDPTALQEEMIGCETELCRLYVILQTAFDANPATALLDTLDSKYDSLSQAIVSDKETLAGCMDSVKETFESEYEALQTKLNNAKTDWSNDGDRILARKDYYNNTLSQIEEEIESLKNAVADAEKAAQELAEKQQVSDGRYTVLKAEYDDLVQEFNAAKDKVESYGNGIAELYADLANNISAQLDATLARLDEAKEQYSLTDNSTLQDADEIKSNIAAYKIYAARKLADIECTDAAAKRAEASASLTDQTIVPSDRDELLAEYSAAVADLDNLRDEVSTVKSDERLVEIADEAKALAQKFADIKERADENAYVLGDVDLDEDGSVNVLDVQTLIEIVGEGTTYQQLYDQNPRQACAADILDDNKLNIADITSLISIILGDDPKVTRVKAYRPAIKSNDSMAVAMIDETDGVRTYAVTLSNMTAYTAAQFDIRTSGNAVVTGVATADRSEAHEAYLFDNNEYHRVILASMDNAVFSGQDGTLLLIQVEGNGDVTISDAMFADSDNSIHEIAKAHSSTIEAIYDYVKDGVMGIYDAAGRRLQTLKSGINIIRHKDGRVTKEMRR